MDNYKSWKGWMQHKFKETAFKFIPMVAPEQDGNYVDAREHDLVYLTEQASKNDATEEDLAALNKEIEHRQFFDDLFDQDFFAAEEANAADVHVNDYDCLRLMLGGVEEMCGDWSAYSLKYVRNLVTVCDTKPAVEISKIFYQIGEYYLSA